MERYHRLHAVRPHLLELSGDVGAAEVAYARAAELTRSKPEQRYLNSCAQRLGRRAEAGADGPGPT